MSGRPLNLDWSRLLPGRTKPSTSEVDIVASPSTGGDDAPNVGVPDHHDQSLKEKHDRLLKGEMRRQLHPGDKFISHPKIHPNELRQSNISLSHQDVGECKLSTESNIIESGTTACKELSLIGIDKGKSIEKTGLRMHRKAQQLLRHSQEEKFSYMNTFSRCFAAIEERAPPSSSCGGAQSLSLSSRHQRKSSRLLCKRRRTSENLDLLDWEFLKVQDVVLLDDEDPSGQTLDDESDEWWITFLLPLCQTEGSQNILSFKE